MSEKQKKQKPKKKKKQEKGKIPKWKLNQMKIQEKKKERRGREGRGRRGEGREERNNNIFSHLEKLPKLPKLPINPKNIHKSIIKIGYDYYYGRIRGSNARAIALLTGIKDVIRDYKTPENKLLRKDLVDTLNPMIDFIDQCRTMGVSMRNSLKYVKKMISVLQPSLSEEEAKKKLIEEIEAYILQNITFSQKQIVKYATERISDGDKILTFGRNEVVRKLLTEAHTVQKKNFSVIIVDSRPFNEGKRLLEELSSIGINCTFILLNAVSHMMKGVNVVFLGGNACFANGYLYARCGTSVVCMTANHYNVPVLVCCETYKFSEKTQLGSISRNEICDPKELFKDDPEESKSLLKEKNVTVLSLLYDLTPIEYVDVVVTELGFIPPTSVSVILRETKKEFFK